jgi:hypothetical protein
MFGMGPLYKVSGPAKDLVTCLAFRNLKTVQDSFSRKFYLNPNNAVVLQVTGVIVWALSVRDRGICRYPD